MTKEQTTTFLEALQVLCASTLEHNNAATNSVLRDAVKVICGKLAGDGHESMTNAIDYQLEVAYTRFSI